MIPVRILRRGGVSYSGGLCGHAGSTEHHRGARRRQTDDPLQPLRTDLVHGLPERQLARRTHQLQQRFVCVLFVLYFAVYHAYTVIGVLISEFPSPCPGLGSPDLVSRRLDAQFMRFWF